MEDITRVIYLCYFLLIFDLPLIRPFLTFTVEHKLIPKSMVQFDKVEFKLSPRDVTFF